jgi:putative ABC transport system permease protein
MNQPQPPKLARSIFEWYCGAASVDDLLGDLDEIFYNHLKTQSPFRAKMIYWKQVISLIFSYAIRKRKRDVSVGVFASSLSIDMFQSYFKVAIRNLIQHKYFSLLNTIGLAIGMSVSLLMISMMSYINTYDNFHEHKENIYTITSTRIDGIDQRNFASSPVVLGEQLQSEFTGIKKIVRINSSLNTEARLDKENIPLSGYYADPDFFTVFTFEMIHGNAASALSKPFSLVLTESAALKIFSKTDVVGTSIELEGLGNFTITGVMKDHPKNTHLEFEVLASYSTLPANTSTHEEQWTDYKNQYVYVLLPQSSGKEALQEYLNKVAAETYSLSPVKVRFQTQSIEGFVTLDLYNSIGPQWEASGFWVFGIISLLILLPACFNYTNISIARALKRAKEIGLRKTMGGVRSQIFFQFIVETIVITSISLIGALFIFFLIRFEFQSMMVEASSLDLSLTVQAVGLFIFFALTTGFIAGAFPAMYFAGLNPIQALKSKPSNKAFSAMRLRKGLTIFQFALSFCFILTLIISSRHYQTLINFDFGFKKENIINVALQNVDPALFKNEFSKLSAVQSVSFSSGSLGLSSSTLWIQQAETVDSIEVAQLFVDAGYIQNLDLELMAGSSFPDDVMSQEQFIIVNEEFVKSSKLSSPREAIGKTFIVDGHELHIIGVLKNFHFAPPQIPIKNFMFRMDQARFAYAQLHVDVRDVYTAFSSMENAWNPLSERHPLKATFYEDDLNDAYTGYRSLIKIAGFLGVLAISISLLGLLGMVVYTSEVRVKEVSIRKVLGASAFSITLLLSREYLKLILWAIVLSAPVFLFLFDNFFTQIPNYHITLSVWDILLSAIALLALGLITITSQTYKTALSNPAETLKSE